MASDGGASDRGPTDAPPEQGATDAADAGFMDAEPAEVGPGDAEPDCSTCAEGQGCLDGTCIRYVDLQVFFDLSCAVMARGKVACWGHNVGAPRLVRNVDDAERVLISPDVACVVRREGRVSCWDFHQALTAQPVEFDGPVKDLRIGEGYTCALLQDQRIQCLGDNRDGQFGDGTVGTTTVARTIQLDPPVDNPMGLFGNWSYSCVVHGSTGHLVDCFGPDVEGGRGATQEIEPVRSWDSSYGYVLTSMKIYGLNQSLGTFGEVAHGAQVRQVSLGCRLFFDGTTDCRAGVYSDYQNNNFDALGVPGEFPSDYVLATSSVAEVGQGPWHTCLRYDDGVIRCLGHNDLGQAGTGVSASTGGHHLVPHLPARPQLITSHEEACAIKDGVLWCWGRSGRQFGRNGRELSPRRVRLPSGIAIDAALFGDRSSNPRGLAVLVGTSSSTEVRLYGDVSLAGVAPSDNVTTTWRIVDSLAGATRLVGGQDELCGLLSDGRVRCVLNGAVIDLPQFEHATDLALERDGAYRVAIVNGNLVCRPKRGSCPSDLATPDPVEQIAVGHQVIVARLRGGRVVAFGANSDLGTAIPALVPNVLDATSVAAYGDHACIVRGTGAVQCWGSNADGRIEFANSSQRYGKAQPLTLSTAYDAISLGDAYSCGVRQDDGAVECWGRNSGCELGTCVGLTHEVLTPIAVPTQ